MKPPMDANERELILKEEVYAVVGCAIEVLNVRGHGLHEKIYENCLCVECRLRGIPYLQQECHPVMYKGEVVGEYVPDLVVQGKLIVDAKTIERIHGPRTRSDAELSSHHRAAGRRNPELQARATRVGATGVDQRTENESE
jgi:GxxExxY protein